MGEVERGGAAIVKHDLELNLGFSLWADLLGLDVGVLDLEGERLLVSAHPTTPFA